MLNQEIGHPIKGLVIDDEHCTDKNRVSQEAVNFYQKLFKANHEPMQTQESSTQMNLFSRQDIDQAMSQTNFHKGVGADCFDGQILQDEQIRIAVAKFLMNMLNSGSIPSYIKNGRLVLLSKSSLSAIAPIDQTRPIVINSHLYKICEKTIQDKLSSLGSTLLKVGAYQTGFKKGSSTHTNLVQTVLEISKNNKRKKQQDTFILIDLKKAYGSVDRGKLIEIIKKRAKQKRIRRSYSSFTLYAIATPSITMITYLQQPKVQSKVEYCHPSSSSSTQTKN